MSLVTMDKLGVACWTIGQHAQKNVLPAIETCERTKLIGSYTRNESVLNNVCSNYKCKRYSSEEELLSDPEVNCVYLSSPTGVHYEQIKKCVIANKSVLVEKTALTKLQQVDEIINLARENGVLVMEAFMYRFHNQFIQLQDILTSKKYGEVIRVECEFGFPHLPKDDIRYSKELDGGALYDAGAYTLSSARILLGENPKVQWSRVVMSDEFEVDIAGNAILTNDKNQLAICNWKFGASYINQVRIWLENAHLVVERAFSKPETYDSQISVLRNGSVLEQIECGADNHFVNMFNYFTACILDNRLEPEIQQVVEQVRILSTVKSFHG